MSQGMSSRASRHSMELELRRWEIDYHSLELIKQVGEGSFGRVGAAGARPLAAACRQNTSLLVAWWRAFQRVLPRHNWRRTDHSELSSLPLAWPHRTMQVYMGRWHQTTVAVKILLSTSVGVDAATEEATRRALTLSNPVLVNLHKVGGAARAVRPGAMPRVLCYQSLHSRLACVVVAVLGLPPSTTSMPSCLCLCIPIARLTT